MFQILKTCKWNQDKIVYMYFRYTKISDIFCLLQKHHIPHTWTVTEYNQKNLRPTLTCTHTLTWDSENQRISSFKTFHQTDRHQGWEQPPQDGSQLCVLFVYHVSNSPWPLMWSQQNFQTCVAFLRVCCFTTGEGASQHLLQLYH